MTQVRIPARSWINNHKSAIFPILAFTIPVIVRIIPEILMGPFIIGFDNLGFYIPNTLLWLHSNINLWNFLANAPLFYSIFIPLVAAGASPVFLLKVISPLLLGFLGLAIYGFARKGLYWSPIKSTVPAILGTVYFVALRISWDMLRNELALIFFFVVLMLINIERLSSWKRYVLLSLAMLAVVLSDQLGAVVMLGVVIFTLAPKLLRREYTRVATLVVVSLPAVLFFVIFFLSSLQKSAFLGYSTNVQLQLSAWTGFASYQSMLISEVGFFLYCFLPLLPLAVLSLKRLGNLQLRSWLFLSLVLVLIPTPVSPFRWILMLTYPLAFYVTETLSRIKTINWKRFKFPLQRVVMLYLVFSTALLSFGYIFMNSNQPFFYFNSSYVNSYSNQIPSSMLQNTISVTDCQDTINALQWFKENVNSSALLLTHTAFYGWALLTLNENQVKSYGYNDPLNAATMVAGEGHTQIYLIWWINGKGWYGQPTVQSSFREVYHSGNIAIYNFINK